MGTSRKLIVAVLATAVSFVVLSQLPLGKQGRIVEVLTFGDWPLEWAVRRQFARKQPELRSILDFVNDFPEVTDLSVTPSGLQVSSQQVQTEQDSSDEPNILQALVSIEAQRVSINEDRVRIHLGSEVRGPTNFEVEYVYKSELELANCDGIAPRDRAKIGHCGFVLSPNWYALYQWYPENTDELEKAVNELK